MTLTYVFGIQPPTGNAVAWGGTQAIPSQTRYVPNGAGIITGVTGPDARVLQGIAGASVQLMCATGATADRPSSAPATALTGALNNLNPFPANLLPFYDTTLSKMVFYVGTDQSSTGWVDYTGAAA
jgi:hypothetical protein